VTNPETEVRYSGRHCVLFC